MSVLMRRDTDTAPRYQQIADALVEQIAAGFYPVGTSLPTESELCVEFSASRYTVREALRRLVEHGMLQRRQGSGSIVIARTPQARYVHSLGSLAELFQFALDTHFVVLSTESVNLSAAMADLIGAVVRNRCSHGLNVDGQIVAGHCLEPSYANAW